MVFNPNLSAENLVFRRKYTFSWK